MSSPDIALFLGEGPDGESELLLVRADEVTLDDTLFGYSIGSIARAEHNGSRARRFSLTAPESNGEMEVGRLIILESADVIIDRYDPSDALGLSAGICQKAVGKLKCGSDVLEGRSDCGDHS